MEEVEKRIVHSNEVLKLKKQHHQRGESRKGFEDERWVVSRSSSASARAIDTTTNKQLKIGYLLELESRMANGKMHSLSRLKKLMSKSPSSDRQQQKGIDAEAEAAGGAHIHSIRELIDQHDAGMGSCSRRCKSATAADSVKQCQQMVSQQNRRKGDDDDDDDDLLLLHRCGDGMGMAKARHGHDGEACISCKSRPFVADIGVVAETSASSSIANRYPQAMSAPSPCRSSRCKADEADRRRKPSSPKALPWHSNPPSTKDFSAHHAHLQVPLFWDFLHKEAIHSPSFSVRNTVPSHSKPTPARRGGGGGGRAMAELMYSPSFDSWAGSRASYERRIRDGASPAYVQAMPIPRTNDDEDAAALMNKKKGAPTRARPQSALSPLSFGGYVEKADEFTPVRSSRECIVGKEWRSSSTNQSMASSCSSSSSSRSGSESIEAAKMKNVPKMGLKSAFWELESALNGRSRRSASAPKTRPGGSVKAPIAAKAPSARLVQRLFASPVKRRPHSQLDQDPIPSASRRMDADDDGGGDGDDGDGDADADADAAQDRSSDYSTNRATVLAPSAQGIDDPLRRSLFSRRVHSSASMPAPRGHGILSSEHSGAEGRHGRAMKSSMTTTTTMMHSSNTGLNAHKFPAVQCYLQCIIEEDRGDVGLPLYTLSRNGSDEVLLARACHGFKEEQKKVCKGMYTFHSGKCGGGGRGGGWRSWMRKRGSRTAAEAEAADLVAKMQVGATTMATKTTMKMRMVSEFVLFGIVGAGSRAGDGRRVRDHHGAAAAPRRSQSLRLISSSNVGSIQPAQADHVRVHHPQFAHADAACASYLSDSDIADLEEGAAAAAACHSSSHREMAAIVIELPVDQHQQHQQHRIRGRVNRPLFSAGNGVDRHGSADRPKAQLLEVQRNATIRETPGLRRYSSRPDAAAAAAADDDDDADVDGDGEEDDDDDDDDAARYGGESVTVVLPREQIHHSLPQGRSCRSTPLIERWRCGGKCDCGGWDLGCGMKVLSSEKPRPASMDKLPFQPLNIYSQGKVQELVLSLTSVQEGSFLLNFQGHLSPLEAFATSIAVIHSRRSASSYLPSPSPPLSSSSSSSSHISPSYIASSSSSSTSSSSRRS